jgi:hypothetical protein
VDDSVDVSGICVAPNGRKFFSAKDLDPKFLWAKELRTANCAGLAEGCCGLI